jgi:hypothetical protein
MPKNAIVPNAKKMLLPCNAKNHAIALQCQKLVVEGLEPPTQGL